MFKVNDRVYDLKFGWGTVNAIDFDHTYPIRVEFEEDFNQCYTLKGCPTAIGTNRTLFFYEPKFENWDETVNRKEWKPEDMERYFYVDSLGIICSDIWRNWETEKRLYKLGNCFKTEENARDSKFYKVFHGGE